MKKLILFVFALAAGSFILSSCGGAGSNKSGSDHATAQTTVKKMTANLDNGKAVYNKVCIACHMTGVAGAPALKDKTRWEEIAKKDMNTLHNDAINGFTGKHGVMPPKGTCTDCSSQDLYDAVAFMLKTAGVSAKK